jgi:hypothetical protein
VQALAARGVVVGRLERGHEVELWDGVDVRLELLEVEQDVGDAHGCVVRDRRSRLEVAHREATVGGGEGGEDGHEEPGGLGGRDGGGGGSSDSDVLRNGCCESGAGLSPFDGVLRVGFFGFGSCLVAEYSG